MATVPDWYTDTFPEWREGAPWVMEDMIHEEPQLVAGIWNRDREATAIAGAMRGAVDRGEPVVVVGCGTSGHAAQAVVEILDAAVRRAVGRGSAVEYRESFEAALDPRHGGLCLAISHGGLTKATLLALESARGGGAATALITAADDAPTHAAAEHVLVTPLVDRSWCHTVGYLSPILAGAIVASQFGGCDLDPRPVADYLDKLLELQDRAEVAAKVFADVGRVVTAGSGVDRPAARELALKINEGARLAATELDLENVLHGHLVAHDEDSALVVFAIDSRDGSRRAARAGQVLRASHHIGLRTVVVIGLGLKDQLGGGADSVLVTPAAPELPGVLATLLGGAIALQLLTVGVVHATGTNPDLLRREERVYREAVGVGETKFPYRPIR
jgi:glucosamine--fructose-6-phosphate aminotransferase (isomerizing)